MTILVFGQTGQVARELAGFTDVVCLDRSAADLGDPESCAKAIREHAPEAVINAAAYTAVDQAETEEAVATVINSASPAVMARACAERSIPFVHISTDYVFEGGGTAPWAPQDDVGPLGAYGRSKLAGEQAIAGAGGVYAILRTSWVFSAHGNNFVKTMLRLGGERDALSIVSDQIGGPTAARDIAQACISTAQQLMDDPHKAGVYHFAGSPDCSWADFAREIFSAANLECEVSGIASSEYPTPAVRPLNSRMDCTATESAFGIQRPDWRKSLTVVLNDLETFS